MRPILFALCALLPALLSSCAAPSARTAFVGNYEGASVRKSPTGQSFVLQLGITQRDGVYSLAASMNDTNREEGMDHTSNTHWDWTGVGAVRDGCLAFKYDSLDAEPAKGTLRRDATGLTLTLAGVQYRLQPSNQ